MSSPPQLPKGSENKEPSKGSENTEPPKEPLLTKNQKIGVGVGAATAATGVGLGLGLSGVGAAGVTAIGTSATATGATLAATGSALGSALLAPIAGLSIGVPVVAPVVVGIALLVYLLVKKHQKNLELYEVMSQAVELIMRIEKCEMLMSDILLEDTGYISNNVTLNRLLSELMAEILKICPTSVIEEFQNLLDRSKDQKEDANLYNDQELSEEKSKSVNVKIRNEYRDRKTKQWRFGLKALRRFTANNFFRKYQYTRIVNKLTMINAFFTTLFAEFTLTAMILEVKIKRSLPSVKGLIESLKQGSKMLHGRDPELLKNGQERTVYNRQEEMLNELSRLVDPLTTKSSKFDQVSDEIKKTIANQAIDTKNFRTDQKLTSKGGTTKKKRKRN
jgi:hypothetical protein